MSGFFVYAGLAGDTDPGRFWSAAMPFSLCVAAGGVAWAWFYHRYQTLYAPWMSHMLADAAIMAS